MFQGGSCRRVKMEGEEGRPGGPGTSRNREEKKRSAEFEEESISEELDISSGRDHESGLGKVVKETEVACLQKTDMIVSALPAGWEVCEQNGRTLYLTPAPNRVKITCLAKLREFKARGRFSEIDESQLVFGRKRRKLSKDYDLEDNKAAGCPEVNASEFSMMEEDDDKEDEDMLVDDEAPKSVLVDNVNRRLMKEQESLSESVRKLTVDPFKDLNHKELLEDTARKLNALRLAASGDVTLLVFEDLQESVKNCKNETEIVQVLWKCPQILKKLESLFSSKLLEQVLSPGFQQENPLRDFPADINQNLYKQIIDFAVLHAQDLLLLLLNLTVKNENPICTTDVIKIAYLFATLSESASSVSSS